MFLNVLVMPGSCINQTKYGCGLPREMRSDTCNGFYCDEIKSYHRDFSDQGRKVDQLITVQRAHTLWDRWTPEANHDLVAAQLVDTWKVEPIELTERLRPFVVWQGLSFVIESS